MVPRWVRLPPRRAMAQLRQTNKMIKEEIKMMINNYGAMNAMMELSLPHDHFNKPYLHGNVKSISIKKKVRAAQKRR